MQAPNEIITLGACITIVEKIIVSLQKNEFSDIIKRTRLYI